MTEENKKKQEVSGLSALSKLGIETRQLTPVEAAEVARKAKLAEDKAEQKRLRKMEESGEVSNVLIKQDDIGYKLHRAKTILYNAIEEGMLSKKQQSAGYFTAGVINLYRKHINQASASFRPLSAKELLEAREDILVFRSAVSDFAAQDYGIRDEMGRIYGLLSGALDIISDLADVERPNYERREQHLCRSGEGRIETLRFDHSVDLREEIKMLREKSGEDKKRKPGSEVDRMVNLTRLMTEQAQQNKPKGDFTPGV